MINPHNTRYTTTLSSGSNSRIKATFKRNAFKGEQELCTQLVNIWDPVAKANTWNQKEGKYTAQITNSLCFTPFTQ